LTVYGHLFDADLDALGEALDGRPVGPLAVQTPDILRAGPDGRSQNVP
jgi:hypothetical protein